MQKIINDPSCVVDEMLQGFVKAHQDIVSTTVHQNFQEVRDSVWPLPAPLPTNLHLFLLMNLQATLISRVQMKFWRCLRR